MHHQVATLSLHQLLHRAAVLAVWVEVAQAVLRWGLLADLEAVEAERMVVIVEPVGLVIRRSDHRVKEILVEPPVTWGRNMEAAAEEDLAQQGLMALEVVEEMAALEHQMT